MLSDKGSWSSGSQVPMYLWGGSQVYKKRFVAHLHYLMSKTHFQKWRTPFDFAIPYDVHVKLVESSNDDMACMDPNDPNVRIIMFRPFYIPLGLRFPMSRLFNKVFHAIECTTS